MPGSLEPGWLGIRPEPGLGGVRLCAGQEHHGACFCARRAGGRAPRQFRPSIRAGQ